MAEYDLFTLAAGIEKLGNEVKNVIAEKFKTKAVMTNIELSPLVRNSYNLLSEEVRISKSLEKLNSRLHNSINIIRRDIAN